MYCTFILITTDCLQLCRKVKLVVVLEKNTGLTDSLGLQITGIAEYSVMSRSVRSVGVSVSSPSDVQMAIMRIIRLHGVTFLPYEYWPSVG